MRKIVLATIGSLGDLHPFIAIGLALKARGFAVVLAVPADHVAKVEAAGLAGVAIVGGFDTLAKALGLPPEQAARRIMADQTYLMDRILMPWLADSTTALDEAMDGAVALVASLFVFAAPIVAELRGVPLVNVLLQPMATFSAYAPPSTPDFRMMAPAPAGPVGRAWNRAVYRVMRGVLRHRHARPVNAVRAAHGLPPSAQALLLETPAATALTLCCYSPLIAPSQPDLPATMRITGFAVFDSDTGAPERLDPALGAFLAAGPAPLVFTLGSFATFAPGDFYATAAAAPRALGLRAVLLTGNDAHAVSTEQVHVCRYAPHSLLFPRACAIIHHGGAGSTGQALRAGKPQLVVPHMGDQHDNGRRILRMGVGRTLSSRRFTTARARAAIAAILSPSLESKAAQIGAQVSRENGADAAADEITALLIAYG
ncbi:UDP:flavonoid glycosyltransferase YjiC (YdhE family) [Sphingomonas sp. BK036]|uniref:glycosyltransferase n=1 Tax=Sphingomonas sp. BK036 TaxID=2512122 RepID=UPI001029B427|nr:glycosyltransferase [Sphingomonas sp. BK036]RZT54726.1 UDP:flavonoid glycosyltransferase YjiC (YdhE family) [Sphingomonas sp. BK036]